MKHSRIIIFSRLPIPGKAKSRLIPLLGKEGAADLQRHLTKKVCSIARSVCLHSGAELEIHFTDGSHREMEDWLGPGTYCLQQGEDIGQKMRSSFERCFAKGADKVVLAGADIPGLTETVFSSALAKVTAAKVAIGPSQDGGYYLIGLHRTNHAALSDSIFANIPWSTGEVFSSTCKRITSQGYGLALLPELMDIDRPEDFLKARQEGLL